MKKRVFKVYCSGGDQYHGYFHADFEGLCPWHKGRGPYKNREAAERAVERHEKVCRFKGPAYVVREVAQPG